MFTIDNYFEELSNNLRNLTRVNLLRVVDMLYEAWLEQGTVFVCGNGGSASTADHFVNDLTKGTMTNGMPRFRAVSLSSNISVISAWANDTSYANIFAEQLRSLQKERDVLVAISASGNSPNVLEAALVAKEKGNKVIALTGFNGGKLAEIADSVLLVNSNDYGVVETLHSFLCHLFERVLKARAQQESPFVSTSQYELGAELR